MFIKAFWLLPVSCSHNLKAQLYVFDTLKVLFWVLKVPISNSVLVKSAPVPDFIVVVLLPSLHFKSYLKSLIFNSVSIVIFDIAIFTATSYPRSFVASGIKVNFEALAYL